jgi:hypothetical protein
MGIDGADVGTTALVQGTGTHGSAVCATCHMQDQNHSFNVENEAADGTKFLSCNQDGCHSSMTLDNTRSLAIDTKFEELEDALIAAGLLHITKDTIYNDHPDQSIDKIVDVLGQKPGTYPAEHVGALFNYEWVLEDRSRGVHNFQFVESLLDVSLEALL